MNFFNISIKDELNNSKGSETHSLNISGIEVDKNLLEQSIREEYDDELQEKDDMIDDLRDEIDYRKEREFDAIREKNIIKKDFDDYKQFSNQRIKALENKISGIERKRRYYQNLEDRNENLEDENYDLNNEIRRLKRDADDSNIRFNQMLNQKSEQENFLMNRLNEYQRINEINANSMFQLSQQNNSLRQEKQRSEEIINFQNSQIFQLQQELDKTKKELEDSKRLNNSNNNQFYQTYSTNNAFQENYENNYYSNFIEPEKKFLKFISMNQKIKEKIEYFEDELFMSIIDKLINKNPQLRDKKLTFLAQGEAVDKSKTVKENKLNSQTVIIIAWLENGEDEDSQGNNFSNYNNSSDTYNNELINELVNNGNNFTNNEINTTTTTSYEFQNDLPYITPTSDSNLENIPSYTTYAEPISTESTTNYINNFSENNAYQSPEMPITYESNVNMNPNPVNNFNSITNETPQTSVVPQISVVPQLSVVPQISVVPQLSIVPNVRIFDPSSNDNNLTTTTNETTNSFIPQVFIFKKNKSKDSL